jgi:hypothetical protein
VGGPPKRYVSAIVSEIANVLDTVQTAQAYLKRKESRKIKGVKSQFHLGGLNWQAKLCGSQRVKLGGPGILTSLKHIPLRAGGNYSKHAYASIEC